MISYRTHINALNESLPNKDTSVSDKLTRVARVKIFIFIYEFWHMSHFHYVRPSLRPLQITTVMPYSGLKGITVK